MRAALAYVARGEAPLGIVYATDAAAEPKVKIVASFPPDSHPPIVYPFAVVGEAPREKARRASSPSCKARRPGRASRRKDFPSPNDAAVSEIQ